MTDKRPDGLKDVSELTMADAAQAKVRGARLSVLSNSGLVALKLTVGISIGSVAVISEAVHSGVDLLAALIAFFAVRASDAPPDDDHPFGHGKIESLSGSVEALLIFGAGVYIIVEAIQAIVHGGTRPDAAGWGVLVMGVSAVVNLLVTRHLFRVARETDSVALEADAHHLKTDVWTSVGVLGGLALVYLTRQPILDPVAAIVVGIFILRTAFGISSDAVRPLVDVALPAHELHIIKQVMQNDKRVKGWHKLRTRKAGSYRHVDVHLLLDDEMSFQEAHDVTEEVEDAMRASLPNVWVTIHSEPFDAEQRHQEQEGGPPASG